MNESFNPDKFITKMFEDEARKNADGTLTVGETVMFSYYRLLEGEHAGKVIIKTCARIDEKSVIFFANSMTWIHTDNLKDIRCERAYPQFNSPMHEIDRSKATWYPDNSNEPQWYEW